MSEAAAGMEALGAAIRRQDAAAVRRVIAEHPDVRAHIDDEVPGGHFGATPLLEAIGCGSREVVDVLLDAGADINRKSHWWAGGFGVLDGDTPLIDYLIERGARVDVHAAARMGRLDELEALMSRNPGLVHARGGDGQTPLHFASSTEVAAFLLAHGADVDARDLDHESTPAQWMIRDRQEIVRFLVSRGCRTDLLMAAALGDSGLARRHLEADPACIRMSVDDRWFPMRDARAAGHIYIWTLGAHKTAPGVAREFGHEHLVEHLRERSPGDLRLQVACEFGEENAVRELLANEPGLAGALPAEAHRRISDAARNNQLDAVRLLLLAGWPVDARGQHGATALHWAGWHGNAAMAREILKYNPPLEIRSTEFDSTPLSWAIYASLHGWHPDRGDYPGTVRTLLEAGAEAPSADANIHASEGVLEVLRLRHQR